MKRTSKVMVFLWLLFGMHFPSCRQTTNDVTEVVERLGNPFEGVPIRWARNIWDMVAHENRVYLGYGDYHRNVGPVTVTYFDPVSGRFIDEATLPEEQISRFHIFDGLLYIPGLDSKESWEFGSFYRWQTTGWQKYRTIPNGVHVFEITKFQGKLFVSIGTSAQTQPHNLISADDGRTWKPIPTQPLPNQPFSIPEMIIHEFFQLKGELYGGTGGTMGTAQGTFPIVLHFNGSAYEMMLVNAFPDNPNPEESIVWHGVTPFRDHIIYIGQRTFTVPSNKKETVDFSPLGLYMAEDLDQVRAIALPESTLPFDLLVYKDRLYVLLSKQVAERHYRLSVLETHDLENWQEILHFTARSFARSFTILDGDVYFGMGGYEQDSSIRSAGEVLRVKRQYYEKFAVSD